MLKIYGIPFSVHTRKVIVAATFKKLPFENEAVIPFTPPPGWNDISPTGKIPAFTDNDVSLCDSSVICAYLERAYPDLALYPSDTHGYVQTLWFEEYADGTIYRDLVHGLFFNKVIRPKILNTQGDHAAIEVILNDTVPTVFGYLEKCLKGEHLVGDRFTLADITLSPTSSTFTISATRSIGASIRSSPRTSLAASGIRRSRRRSPQNKGPRLEWDSIGAS